MCQKLTNNFILYYETFNVQVHVHVHCTTANCDDVESSDIRIVQECKPHRQHAVLF